MSTTWINRGHLYSPHVRPVMVDCNFLVDADDASGLGITNLKGQGVASVRMNSTATFTGTTHTGTASITGISSTAGLAVGMSVSGTDIPAGAYITAINSSTAITISVAATTGHSGQSNTYSSGRGNPLAGFIEVKLTDNFNRIYNVDSDWSGPTSGSSLLIDASDANLTPGSPYTITVVGDATAADWLAVGVPPGITPAVGVSFIAIATGSGTSSTSAVEAPASGASGIDHIEALGDPNTVLGPVPVGGSPNVGGTLILRTCLDGATATAADGTLIRLRFYLNQSNVLVAGE